ncbi:MAG TPA: hypothetical protein VHU83_00835 [Bryobacteraceae bacterium]|jgi:hypothetical protein|nr:hypothetical protein [Bryobacteraceae bacterium]
MLDTLRKLNDHEALILLSSTVHYLLPDPGVGSPVTDVLNAPARSREKLLHELRQKLKLSEDDQSPRAQAEIFDTLSSEISKYALKDSDIRQIKARLGARGDLPPGAYEIDIDPAVRGGLASRGIRPSHIEEAVRAPDALRHLNSQTCEFLVSLFVKRVGSGKHAFTLFVVAQRDGYLLRVRDALRVYDADVNREHATEPLAVLRAFLNKYGLPVRMGPKSGLLLLNEVFPFVGTRKDVDDVTFIAGKPWREFNATNQWESDFGRFAVAGSPILNAVLLWKHSAMLNVVEIPIAYAFNGDQYDDDLRGHGVPVPR